ncbi:MAG: SLBB domain-containing protein, partial [Acidobacteriota bacterium]|nr:SLBB domain-containing protein [Acidobacteriota bacterium]
TPVGPQLYRLGPGDEIKVQQPNAEEIDGATARVDDQGNVNLPLAGRTAVGGLTLQETEAQVKKSLSRLLVRPEPVISITEYRSQPVSVLGEVNTAGVIQLQGRKTLVEMLSMAGGPKSDAGTDVQISRRLAYGKLPLPSATTDATGEYSVAKVNLSALLNGANSSENIVIFPQDIISVPRAELVYVVGDVRKPGGFPLNSSGGVSVLQAVSLAEGLGPQASPKKAKIFRQVDASGKDTGAKKEIDVDVAAILAGKSSDFILSPKDVLFIPDSASKKIGIRAAEAALQAATGVAIWKL